MSRVQAFSLRSSEQEEGKMLWAPKKPSFWRWRDLSKDLKHEYRLGKEASMREEESGGYESLDEFAKGVGWRKGPLVLDLVVQFLTLCVDAPLLQRSLFPRNRSRVYMARPRRPLVPSLCFCGAYAAPHGLQRGQAPGIISPTTQGLTVSQQTCLGLRKAKLDGARVCVLRRLPGSAGPPPPFPPALPHFRAAEGRPGPEVLLLQRAACSWWAGGRRYTLPGSPPRPAGALSSLSRLSSQTHTHACTLTHPPSPSGSPLRAWSGFAVPATSCRFRRWGRAVGLAREASRAVPAPIVRLAGEHSGQARVGHTEPPASGGAHARGGRRNRPSFAKTRDALRQ